MALSADEERAFAELAANFTSTAGPAGDPRTRTRVALVLAALCLGLLACYTVALRL